MDLKKEKGPRKIFPTLSTAFFVVILTQSLISHKTRVHIFATLAAKSPKHRNTLHCFFRYIKHFILSTCAGVYSLPPASTENNPNRRLDAFPSQPLVASRANEILACLTPVPRIFRFSLLSLCQRAIQSFFVQLGVPVVIHAQR